MAAADFVTGIFSFLDTINTNSIEKMLFTSFVFFPSSNVIRVFPTFLCSHQSSCDFFFLKEFPNLSIFGLLYISLSANSYSWALLSMWKQGEFMHSDFYQG